MRTALLVLMLACTTCAVELKLKDGTSVTGDPICENKSTVVLKDHGSTVTLFKKMIASADTVSLEGKREFMFGDSLLLKEKNEIVFINNTGDSCLVRLRRLPEGLRYKESVIGIGDTAVMAVPDGSYFETVRVWKGDVEYFIQGQPAEIITKCGEFKRIEIELKKYLGDSVPKLKGPKIAFERE